MVRKEHKLTEENRKKGVVFTKPEVVTKMLDLAGFCDSKNLSGIRVLEPSAGDGAFVEEILQRLFRSSVTFGFSFIEVLKTYRFFELSPYYSEILKKRITIFLSSKGFKLPPNLIKTENFLLNHQSGKFDLIIGNPPYIRYDHIPKELIETYRKKFSTFQNRSDLYIPFFEKGLKKLTRQGALIFLCSNRWLKSQYGSALRKKVGKEYQLSRVIDLEGTNPFTQRVIAYPGIFIIKNQIPTDPPSFQRVDSIENLQFIENGTPKSGEQISLKNGEFEWFKNSDLPLSGIINQGFRIGIGVASGCDKVFIRKDFLEKDLLEKDRALPIITSKDLRNNQFSWKGNYIVNPFSKYGKLIDLEKYPKTQQYLQQNRKILEKRHIAKKYPEKWYRTIDRIDPFLLKKPKILLPDISGNNKIFIDGGKYYPHHNIYFITGPSLFDLQILAAILLSDFVREQLLKIGNKMNGGYPRWQSQNLKKLLIPNIDSFSSQQKKEFVDSFKNQDKNRVDHLIQDYLEENKGKKQGQLALFPQ